MILMACALVPLIGAALALSSIKAISPARVIVLAASANLALALYGAVAPVESVERLFGNYFIADATSRLFLVLISATFLGIALYVSHWMQAASLVGSGDTTASATSELPLEIDTIFPANLRGANTHYYVFLALLFMATSVLAVLSNNLITMWVFLEAGTLAVTPLIFLRSGRESFRAAWKYLLFSNIGLGFNFLGLMCLSKGMEIQHGPEQITFFLNEVGTFTTLGPKLWTDLGLLLVVFGLGTKLGLAPMYTWLPEAYDAAPPSVTALLSAVQFNTVMLALFRTLSLYRVFDPDLISYELMGLGIASIAVAAVHIVTTKSYKRLIAYASINHAGVIAIGLSVGKSASYGVVLYVLSNAFVKAVLFLTCGNIKSHFRTKRIADLSGLIQSMPYSGWFLMVGIFALLGFAPFGSFLGEVVIMSSMLESDEYFLFALFCVLLTIIFIATGRAVFPMIWGEPKEHHVHKIETLGSVFPILFLIAVLVSMGIYLPGPANALVQEVARVLGGKQ